ncbi:MAG TPA: sigma-70 family RNA polymerase sigma factor [Casimicrobiaceae bacterium]|nr:sigma-70 family RNA polymerase sigma factor [Casimicrobiaceae bacterium]
MENDDETELVERCQHGDRDAFSRLVVRYQRPIYNAALWILRKPEDASDVAQSVFLKVAERLDEYDPRYRFFSWIYRIAVNESLNVLRRKGHEEALDEEVEIADEGSGDPERKLSDKERAERVRRALMESSTSDRTVLMLRHFGELSYEEIGAVLDLDEKTVKSRLFDARGRLRTRLKGLMSDSK